MSDPITDQKDLNYDELIPTLPRDKEGFVIGFDIYAGDDETKQEENKKEIRDFFDRYGMVVITNLLTDDELTKSQAEVYDFVEEHYPQFKRNDTSTWSNIHGISAKLGMITDWPCMSSQYCKNRCKWNIYRAFSSILDSEDVYCNIGRVGFFRPTKNIRVVSKTEEEKERIKYEDKPEWKTLDGLEWLHIDYNPALNHSTTYAFMPTKYFKEHKDKYDPYEKPRVQGILALVDCDDSTGSFQCVPGFHHILSQWFRLGKQAIEPKIVMERYQFDKYHPIHKHVQKIPLRKGSLVVWNSKLPHCSYPNNGEKPRMVQYIQFARRDDPAVRPVRFGIPQVGPWGPWELTLHLPNDFEWTPLAKQIYSIDIPHPDEQENVANKSNANQQQTWSCQLL